MRCNDAFSQCRQSASLYHSSKHYKLQNDGQGMETMLVKEQVRFAELEQLQVVSIVDISVPKRTHKHTVRPHLHRRHVRHDANTYS